MLLPIFKGAYNRVSIKSIQQVTINLSSVTSNTATITAVSTSNAFIMFQGVEEPGPTNGSPNQTNTRVELTNSTTVTAFTASSNGDTRVVHAVVIEFQPGAINSIQAGTILLADNSNASGTNSVTATITSVNTAKSFCIWLGGTLASVGVGTLMYSVYSAVALTNATTVTATANNSLSVAGTPWKVGYMVVEFR